MSKVEETNFQLTFSKNSKKNRDYTIYMDFILSLSSSDKLHHDIQRQLIFFLKTTVNSKKGAK